MPSPNSPLAIHGISTKWFLSPQTRLSVPTFIGKGDVVKVPGSITLYVKRPKSVTAGRPFAVNDSIKLSGYMSKIERPVPGFHSPMEIHLQHPIEMSEFRYQKCIEAGKTTAILGSVSDYHKKN